MPWLALFINFEIFKANDMKKNLVILFLMVGLFSCGFGDQADLDKMESAVRQYLKYRDTENGITSNINYFKAVSYEEIPENKQVEPDDYYLCKIYMQGTWSYYNSSRVFNVEDTLRCIFSKKKVFVRIENEDKLK